MRNVFGTPVTRCYSVPRPSTEYASVQHGVMDGQVGCSRRPVEALATALTVAVSAVRTWDPDVWGLLHRHLVIPLPVFNFLLFLYPFPA